MNAEELRHLLADKPLVLDGGLATELENQGHALNDSLWSARLLSDSPGAIVETHLSFLRAGANIITSCSYQATVDGLMEKLGVTQERAETYIGNSVELARESRSQFQKESGLANRVALIAAGVGPFGAYLANGAEYTGDYSLDWRALADFHRPRWELLLERKPDLVLCETIPQRNELLALARLSDECELGVIVSMSCRDGRHLADGTPLAECAVMLADSKVAAIGINCVSPKVAVEAVETLAEYAKLPIVAYPNSGEQYSASHKEWSGRQGVTDFETVAGRLLKAGCRIVGGCCRTTPADISQVAKILG